MHEQPETVVILDFGSQYTQLIARRVREAHVFSLIFPCNAPLERILAVKPRGLILSGGPANVYDRRAPKFHVELLHTGIPMLGICYGMQLVGHHCGGRVAKTHLREYGYADLTLDAHDDLFHGLTHTIQCWMSHGDRVTELPPGFDVIAHTENSPIASVRHKEKRIYGVQFHPEVAHTPQGAHILQNFLYRVCGLKGAWTAQSFVEQATQEIRERVGTAKVVLGLSGGVDSSVAALLIHRAIGKQLVCIFVDNGLLRLKERERVAQLFKQHFKMNLKVVRAEQAFLTKLKGVIDPERKRKIIGRTFIHVFEQEAKQLGRVQYLGQGTLYPDIIESVAYHGGPTAVIKSHHNVGGLPKRMRLKLIEPLKELFKDEVREVGRVLGLSSDIVNRQPFPGPGLAVRIIGAITKERLELLRAADWIVIDEMKHADLYQKIWQSFAVLLPVKSVGVMGDERTYEHVIAVRAVSSLDGMTADWVKLPPEVLTRISNRIINEVKGVNRVCYDISSKPPSTIEWE